MKKKGFTLIELLAVIVILAVIALIATPLIMDVIERARKSSYIESVNGILDAGEKYRLESMLDNSNYQTMIDLTSDILSIKGKKPDKGTLFINEKGNMHIIALYGEYCIEKTNEEKSPRVVDSSICENIKEPDESRTMVYGIKREIETESSAWERIEDSIGLVANSQVGATEVQNDFDNIYPWSDIISYNYDTETKEIVAVYGEENFTFTPEGNVEVLTKIPEFYYKRVQEDGYEYIYISKDQKEGYTKSEEFSIGRYTMSGDSTRVHSRSGVTPLANTTIADFRTYARKLGSEFSQLDYHYFILQLLYLVEYADYNSQVKLGPGYTNDTHTTLINSGGCDILGMHSGSVDGTDNSSVIYRGIEDIFGNMYQFVDGIKIKDYQAYICYDKDQYEIDTFDGCYQPIGYANANIAGQYISKLGYDVNNPLIAFPIETNGSSINYVTDIYFSANGSRLVAFGGSYAHGLNAGLWLWSGDHVFLGRNTSTGARLIKTN